ncbi:MAG: hypothetical protein CMO55_28520 [Verrucomicrobiales bacterium]|nr:hypothetical protein [Verrucomicrobiales bacterium]
MGTMQLPELQGYSYEDLLGEDPFGWSYVCSHESGERRVIKVFKAQATNESLLHYYFDKFSDPDFGLPGIAPVYDYVLQGDDSLSACAVPFFGWKGKDKQRWQVTSLKGLMHLLTPDQSVDIIRKLAESLAEAHENGVFHGGLRPGNVFLTGDSGDGHKLQIGDFGQILIGGLQYLEADDLLFYVSPEQLSTGDFSGENGKAWDIYAFGVIAFQMLTGHLPRLDRLRQQFIERPDSLKTAGAVSYGQLTHISEYVIGQLDSERPVEWPDEATDSENAKLRRAIEACLAYEPADRPSSMAEVAELIGASPAPVVEELESEGDSLEFGSGELEFDESSSSSVKTGSRKKIFGGEKASIAGVGGKIGKLPFIRVFVTNPSLKWQIAAVIALIAMLPMTFFLVNLNMELRATRTELTVEAKELQANVEKQAAAYRRAIRTNQKDTEQLKAEINEVEDSRSRMVGEAKLARQILRQTQENGDQFFRLVLENKDTDVPGFREKRAKALLEGRRHYERLVEVYGDAPDFIVSTANAYFYLGQIYREMGEFGKALASYGEAERRYLALLDDSQTTSIDFVKNIAIAKRSLGQLSMKSGEYSIARHYFTESSRYWAETRSRDTSEALNAAISIHENSLAIVNCEIAMGRGDAALDAARSVGAQILKLQEQAPDNPKIIGILARSFGLAADILRQNGEIDSAKEAYQQSADLFARAITLNAAVDAYHLGLGNSLAGVGLIENDVEKLESSAEVLSRVVGRNPFEPEYQRTLADVYGALAANQRDGGKLKNAIEFEKEALEILQPIVKSNPNSPESVLYSYSQRLAHLAELLGDAGEFDSSRAPLQEAITVLEKISKSDHATSEFHRGLARARGLAGFACIKSGDKTGAKEHLELARAEWENYMASNPEDSDAAQAAKWTSDQLKTLQ